MYPGDPSASAAERINCFVSGTEVSGAFVGGLKAWYSGPVREICTARGNRLTVTPNHPIFTTQGWFAANEITEAHALFANGGQVEFAGFSRLDSEDSPIFIEDVFQSLRTYGSSLIAGREIDLHGDAKFGNGYIHVVGPKRELQDDFFVMLAKYLSNLRNELTDSVLIALHAYSPFNPAFNRIPVPASASPKIATLPSQNLRVVRAQSSLVPFELLRLGKAAYWDTAFAEKTPYRDSTYTKFVSELTRVSSGQISSDNVVGVREYEFSGHVYDLQSPHGWLLANNILASNCRCSVTTDFL
jgi:hypothetical protein